MTDLSFLGDGLPVPAALVQKGFDGHIDGFHAPILGKFSCDVKEHFTKRPGHPHHMTEGNSINRVLARNLAYWMGEAKLTQTALAVKAGLSQKTISNYLNPDQRVEGSKGKEPSAKLTELARIADALEVGTWQLLRDMTESERAFYAQIESSYSQMREAAEAAAKQAAEQEARANERALSAAKVAPPKGVVRKKAA
jgi:transcriptional regulator with XRE-family HTH domain